MARSTAAPAPPMTVHRAAERAPERPLPPLRPLQGADPSHAPVLRRTVDDDAASPSGGASTPGAAGGAGADGSAPGRGEAGNEVQLLATEVWMLLRRRLQNEAERRGRW
jgi:hypothetical protein